MQPFYSYKKRTLLRTKRYSTVETRPYSRNFNTSYDGDHYWDKWCRMHRNLFCHDTDRLFISGYSKGSYYGV